MYPILFYNKNRMKLSNRIFFVTLFYNFTSQNSPINWKISHILPKKIQQFSATKVALASAKIAILPQKLSKVSLHFFVTKFFDLHRRDTILRPRSQNCILFYSYNKNRMKLSNIIFLLLYSMILQAKILR